MRPTSFDTLLAQEAQKRGYTPIQIAAMVGNRYQESANRPLDAVGDNGSAYGAFQWRLDRQNALRQSGDVSNPMTQVNHFFNELDGPEQKAGQLLRNSQTLEDANSAMKRFLRYGDNSEGTRLNYARAYLGQNGEVDAGGGDDPTAAKGGVPPRQQSQTPYTDSLLEGGPMALFGKGQAGYDWGNALMGVGAGLASINSPQQAAAITAQMQARNPASNIQSQYDQNTGTWYHYDKRTGQTQSYQDPNWLDNRTKAAQALNKARADAQGAKPKDVETFRGTQDNMDMTANILNDLVDVRQVAAANPNAFGIYGKLRTQLGAALDGMGDSKIAEIAKSVVPNVSDEDIMALGKLQRVRNQLVALAQLPQKGPQTESDAKRYDLANFDQLSNMSGKALVGTLDNLIEDHGKAYSRLQSYYKGDLAKFNADPRFDTNMVDYFANQKTTLDDRLKKYKDTPVQQAAPAAPAQPGAPAGETPEQRLERLRKQMNNK